MLQILYKLVERRETESNFKNLDSSTYVHKHVHFLSEYP